MAILRKVAPLGVERKRAADALGHALAEEILADRDLPPADRSAMDGYALQSLDLSHPPCELKLVGEVAAGSPNRPKVNTGSCVRIMTGGNIPPGADAVVMVERATENGDKVQFRSPAVKGENIIRQAEDAHFGEVLLDIGVRLGPLQLGVCAAVGFVNVRVYRRPQIAIICTGEELRNTEATVEAHELRNSNGPALCGALATLGFPMVEHLVVRDSIEELVAELTRVAAFSDVVLLTGGVSKGKYDFVRKAIEILGAPVLFHGVTMKPGKPLLCATLSGNKFIFGLPGTPLSAMTGFYEFVLPTLRRLSGIQPAEVRPSLYLSTILPIKTKGGRTHFILARLEYRKTGLCVEPITSRSSSDFVAGGRSDGVIVVPPEIREIEAGTIVEFRSWKPHL